MGELPKDLTVTIDGEPPIKRGPGGPTETRRKRKEQRSKAGQLLEEQFKRALQEAGFEPGLRFPWDPMNAQVKLEIEMFLGSCKADAANIIGGIADELQNIAYANDKQLQEIYYKEHGEEVESDRYIIRLSALST